MSGPGYNEQKAGFSQKLGGFPLWLVYSLYNPVSQCHGHQWAGKQSGANIGVQNHLIFIEKAAGSES